MATKCFITCITISQYNMMLRRREEDTGDECIITVHEIRNFFVMCVCVFFLRH